MAWAGPTSGLTHRWPMDDANVSGTSIVDVVAALNGTASGTGITSAAGPIAGSTARQTAGASFISLSGAPMAPLNGAWSIGFWQFIANIATAADGTNVMFMGLQDSSARGLRIGNAIDETHGGAVVIVNSNVIDFTTAAVYANGVWAHVCVTSDGTKAGTTFYVNAAVVAQGVADGAPTNTTANTFFGLNTTQRLCPAGNRLYQIVTYNRALSSTEVTALFNAESAPTGISGTASITEASDTLTGASQLALQGVANKSEASDTVTAAAALALTGSLSRNEIGDVVTATGALAISGNAATTEANDTLSAAGQGPQADIHGAADIREENDTLSASGHNSFILPDEITQTKQDITKTTLLTFSDGTTLTSAVTNALAVNMANLPDAGIRGKGAQIYVTDAPGGSNVFWSDGTNWRDAARNLLG